MADENKIRETLARRGFANNEIDSFLQYQAAGGKRSQLGAGAFTSQANIKPYQQPSDAITEFSSSIYNGLVPTLAEAVAVVPNLAVGWTGDNTVARGAEHITNTAMDWVDNNLRAYVAPENNQGILRLNDNNEIEFTSARSFMNGLGQGIGSLLSFFIPGGVLARTTRLGATAATMLTGSLISAPMIYDAGRKAGLSNADNVRMTLALSPIVGAIELVGGLETATLSKIAGQETKQTIREIGERGLTEALEKVAKAGISSSDDFVAATKEGLFSLRGLGQKLTNPEVIKNSIGEAGEEYLQNVVQKAGEQLYDSFYSNGAAVGQGAFGTQIMLPEGSTEGIFGSRYNKKDFIDDFSSAIYGGILGYGMSAVTTPVVNQSLYGLVDMAVRKDKLPETMQRIDASLQNMKAEGKIQDAAPVMQQVQNMAQVSTLLKSSDESKMTPAMRYDAYNWQYNERPVFEGTVAQYEGMKQQLSSLIEQGSTDTIAISTLQKGLAENYEKFRRSSDAITAINDHVRSIASVGQTTPIKQTLDNISAKKYDVSTDPQMSSLLSGYNPAPQQPQAAAENKQNAAEAQPSPSVGGVGAQQFTQQQPSTSLDNLIGVPVSYRGMTGTVAKDDVDGYIFQPEGESREYILGKGDLMASDVGIEFNNDELQASQSIAAQPTQQEDTTSEEIDEVEVREQEQPTKPVYTPPSLEGNSVTMNNRTYEVSMVNRNALGDPVSVRMVNTETGQTVTSRNQDLLLAVAINDEESRLSTSTVTPTDAVDIVNNELQAAYPDGLPPHIAMVNRMIDAMPDAVAEVMELMEADYRGFPNEQREMVKSAREWMDKMLKAISDSNFTADQKQEALDMFDTFNNNLIEYYYALGEQETAAELDQQRTKKYESANESTNEATTTSTGKQVRGDEEIEPNPVEVARQLLTEFEQVQATTLGADAEELTLMPQEVFEQVKVDNAELPGDDIYAEQINAAEKARAEVETAIVEQVDQLTNPEVTDEYNGEGIIPAIFLYSFNEQQENRGQRVRGENSTLQQIAEQHTFPFKVINNFTGRVYEVTGANDDNFEIKGEENVNSSEQSYQYLPIVRYSEKFDDEAAAIDIIGTAMAIPSNDGASENGTTNQGAGTDNKAGNDAANTGTDEQDTGSRESSENESKPKTTEKSGQGRSVKPIEIDTDKTIAERYAAAKLAYAKDEDGNDYIEERILPDGTVRRVKLVLGDAFAITPSHNPFTFSKSVGFPVTDNGKTVNDNDYENSPEAQAIVMKMGDNYDGRALDDLPFVKNGIVYSGNNRTMSRQRSAQQGSDMAYTDTLKQRARRYFFEKKQVESLAHPMIWFEIVDDIEPTTEEFRKYNQAAVKQKSPIERAVELGKIMAERPGVISRIGALIENYDNLSSFYASRDAKQVFDLLQRERIINEMERPRYTDAEGNVTDSGKEFLESLMIGSVLSEDNVRALNQDGNKSIRGRIVAAMKELTDNFKLDKYNILREINNAIKVQVQLNLAKERQTEEMRRMKNDEDRYNFLLNQYLASMQLFERQDLTTESILLNVLLNKGERAFKEAMANYNTRAQDAASGQASMFGNSEAVRTKADIVKDLLQYYRDLNKLTDSEKKILTAYESIKQGNIKIAVSKSEIEKSKQEIDNLLNFDC